MKKEEEIREKGKALQGILNDGQKSTRHFMLPDYQQGWLDCLEWILK